MRIGWAAQPTGVKSAYAGWLSVVAAASAAGAALCGLRDLAASKRWSEAAFDAIFTTDRPVVFAHHGYPTLIHRLTYRRTNHQNFHVRGYCEEGTTTTPFDMVMMNDLDRYHLVMDVIDRVPGLRDRAAGVRQLMEDQRQTSDEAKRKEFLRKAEQITVVDDPARVWWRFGVAQLVTTKKVQGLEVYPDQIVRFQYASLTK